VITILILVLVAGASYYGYETYVKKDTEEEVVSIEIPNSDLEDDFDQDGLENWEEFLWKTDPLNPDSDGDGTSDGEEVASGRDPRKVGPNDSIKDNPENPDTPKTDLLAQQFALEYFTLKQSGSDLTPEMQDRIVQSLVDESYERAPLELYGVNQLNIEDISTDLTFKKYGNDLGTVLIETNNPNVSEDPLTIVEDALANEDEDLLADLDLYIEGYREIIDKMLEISVPKDLSDIHLNLVNSSYYVLYSLEGMRDIFDDPLGGFISISDYTDSTNLLRNSIEDLSDFMESHNISYQQTESGFAVFSGI